MFSVKTSLTEIWLKSVDIHQGHEYNLDINVFSVFFYTFCHVDSLTSHWLLSDDGGDETGEIGGARGRETWADTPDTGRVRGMIRLNGEYLYRNVSAPRSQKGVDCELVGNLALSN